MINEGVRHPVVHDPAGQCFPTEMTADLQIVTQSASLVLGAKCGLVVRQIVIHREPGRRLGH
jgi:hypothetical protein